ncbi:hypothetical protein KKC91_02880 [bacterium]|nr:hypothetical protein [bacterium]
MKGQKKFSTKNIILSVLSAIFLFSFTDFSKAQDVSYRKEDIQGLINNHISFQIHRVALSYILTEDISYAKTLKNILIEEAKEKKFSKPAHSVKYIQYQAMMRGIYYLDIKDIPSLFTEHEKDIIVEWFKAITDRTFTVEWVDWLYAFAFKRLPQGPYENQEIGYGALSVFGEIIKEKYPELAKKCFDYVEEKAVLWRGNFRNTDDSLSYQGVWINNAYVSARYHPILSLLGNENCRKSFEWILKQWPPNGMAPGYNDVHPHIMPDTMMLGTHIFSDGRYKWLANRMLKSGLVKENDLDFVYGLKFWDDQIEPVTPQIGSCYIEAPGNFPHDPGPVGPDKIVFREGWDKDSLYSLLNLRYSGWHKYKATNCIVSLMYGVPFVVEDMIVKRNKWVPVGRKDYRDTRIDRFRLNGFQIQKRGFALLLSKIIPDMSVWEQDPPQFAEVAFFENMSEADISKTEITDWHGWRHIRVSTLVKGDSSYLVVMDNAEGETNKKTALTWHLKGQSMLKDGHIKLEQDGYKMDVFYPHDQDWYKEDIMDSKEIYPPAGYIHDPDVDLVMISEGKSKVGFITLFMPDVYDENFEVENIEVMNSNNKSAYPSAIGLKVKFPGYSEIIGTRFISGRYKYDILLTDAEWFLSRIKKGRAEVTYKNATYLEIVTDNKPVLITLDGLELEEGKTWEFLQGSIKIKLSEEKGQLEIVWREYVK